MINVTTKAIRMWAKERSLHEADPKAQMLKLSEEVGELASAIGKDKSENEIKEEIGDVYVVITILAMQLGLRVEDCIDLAYNKIIDRKGKMINGVFVKEDDLND